MLHSFLCISTICVTFPPGGAIGKATTDSNNVDDDDNVANTYAEFCSEHAPVCDHILSIRQSVLRHLMETTGTYLENLNEK